MSTSIIDFAASEGIDFRFFAFSLFKFAIFNGGWNEIGEISLG